MLKNNKALSIVEIMVAIMILSFVMLFVLAVYFPGIKFRSYIKNEFEAHAEALRWLELVKTKVRYGELYNTSSPYWFDLNAYDPDPTKSSPLREDYSGTQKWPLYNNVDNLEVKYRIQDRQLNTAALEPHKRISVRVRWQERAPVEEQE